MQNHWLMLPAVALTGNEATSESGIFLDASEDTMEVAGDSEQMVTEEKIAENAEEMVAAAEDDGEAILTEASGSWEQIPETEPPAVSEETTPGGGESEPADSGSAVSAAASSEIPQTSVEETNSGTVAESDATGISSGSSSDPEDVVATEESTSTSADTGTEESLSEETVSEESSVDSEELSAEVEEQEKTEGEEEVFGSGKLLFRGKNYSVTIEYNADAKIPDTAELRVRELEEDSEEYQAHYETAKNNAKENGAQVRTARFFDITIVSPEKNADDADEEVWREIEPAAQVKVNITFDKEELELPEKTEVEVLHFADENNAEAVEKAKENARLNQIDNCEFITGKAEDLAGSLPDADVIVVDPPRKGLDRIVTDTILRVRPERVVYVSCDSATLARDLALFTAGGYELRKIQPVDQFCHSVHVESCVLLERVSNRKADSYSRKSMIMTR